jgi:hypothetical protein
MKSLRHNERCSNCKQHVQDLLSAAFASVKVEYDLDLPSRLDGYRDTDAFSTLESIYIALCRHRGYNDFILAKKLAKVDFYLPTQGWVVEFDESQHFTQPRAIALKLYPNGFLPGFSITRWHSLCVEMQSKDNDPPFRDEQRAWYDTLRDFASETGHVKRTVRLYARDEVWCTLDPELPADVTRFKNLVANYVTHGSAGKQAGLCQA